MKTEIDKFVKESKANLKKAGLKEGDYCVLVTSDQVTIGIYKSLDRFKERISKDVKKFSDNNINWQVCSFD